MCILIQGCDVLNVCHLVHLRGSIMSSTSMYQQSMSFVRAVPSVGISVAWLLHAVLTHTWSVD